MNVLTSYRQYGNQSEVGGQLFVDINQPDGIWLVKATPPHPADKCSYRSVEFNKLRCLEEIRQASKEGLQFIGYWHTHPQDIPQLSAQDRLSIRNFVIRNRHIQECSLAVVVGQSYSCNGIRAWLCTPNTITLNNEL